MFPTDSDPQKNHGSDGSDSRMEPGTLLRPATQTDSLNASAYSAGVSSSPASSSSSWGITNPSQWGMETRPNLAAGSVLKERFVLEAIVGKGGMGTVFRARDLRKVEAQDRFPYVAIKVLNEDFQRHPDSLKQLQREARKAQQLAHPHIVSVHDFDRDGANVFLVMELLEGQSLDKVIKKTDGKGLPLTEALAIIAALGQALGHAHSKNVIHLDFKPANAFLCNDGTVKVLDFGIARAKQRVDLPDAEQTHFNVSALGALTPSYASCEMLLGVDPDPRDDIYALACVAYELLTGKHPFGRQSAQFAQEYKLKPARPRGLPRQNWQALLHGLAFEREQRTATTAQLIAGLSNKEKIGSSLWAVVAGMAALAVAAAWYWPRLISNSAEIMVGGDTDSNTDAKIGSSNELSQPVRNSGTGASSASTPANMTATIMTSSPVAPSSAVAVAEQVASTQLEQLKQRCLTAANSDDVDLAARLLQQLKAQLPTTDPFVVFTAPQAIANAYSRLTDGEIQAGNYQAASYQLSAGQRFVADLPALRARKMVLGQVVAVDSYLRSAGPLKAEEIEKQLTVIKRSYPAGYTAVERNLAAVLAERINTESGQSPSKAADLVVAAKQAFAAVPAIVSLRSPVDSVSPSAAATQERNPAEAISQAAGAVVPASVLIVGGKALSKQISVDNVSGALTETGTSKVRASIHNRTNDQLMVEARAVFRGARGELAESEEVWRRVFIKPGATGSFEAYSMSFSVKQITIEIREGKQ